MVKISNAGVKALNQFCQWGKSVITGGYISRVYTKGERKEEGGGGGLFPRLGRPDPQIGMDGEYFLKVCYVSCTHKLRFF